MDDKLKELLQEQMKKEADAIMEEVNSDPNMKDVKAPEELREELFKKIREYEEKKALDNLSSDDKEHIHTGKTYKKKRKRRWVKVVATIAAIIAILGVGMTAMGVPEKVIEKVQGMMDGKEQLNVEEKEGRTAEVKISIEEEAYKQIEEEFGFTPVRMFYLPDGMEFKQVEIDKVLQTAQVVYRGEDKVINYLIRPNYRTSSLGTDVEDELVNEFKKEVNGVIIEVEQYIIEENQTERWIVEFKNQEVQYILIMMGLDEMEVDEIIDNLYF